ncbi:MAG: ribonucleoside-diphosphate reductase subunit alpha [Candidatus Avilachnospira sp.]|jgi:ribonucleoside-diphosphate reductase alpha chain
MKSIVKRSGQMEEYRPEKIISAMRKAFDSTDNNIGDEELNKLLLIVESKISEDAGSGLSVESIQDSVEEALMEKGYFKEAKAYILYREKRSELRNARMEINRAVGDEAVERVLIDIEKDFPGEEYSLTKLALKFKGFIKSQMSTDEKLAALTKAAVELTDETATRWENIASRILDFSFMRSLAYESERRGIGCFYEKLRYLTEEGLYGSYIMENYSRAELEEAAKFIDNERDKLLNYSGLDLLIKRYVIRTHDHVPMETPQEMFLRIALHLAMKERDRLTWVKKFYDMLSKLEVTMATPTTSNAGKPYHQLSSCFIDTVPDSLRGIFRSVDNFAEVSKFGGGMGLYFGKVRAKGGSIRGFEGAAGGVIRWIRIINDTAVAVDQLGMRQGAVAVYLDIWHKDVPEFLNLRTNNGDDRMKAHDVFPAVCYPDLFWRMAKEDLNQDWYMMCPHDILMVKGYCLEDFYGEEWEKRYWDCVRDSRISKRVICLKDMVRLILKSAVETGTPFTFNRDTVNRANPNGHEGMIYCSNLCTEIAQNMKAIETVSIEVKTSEGDTVVVNTTRPGEFVVCNLASLSLGHLPVKDKEYMREVVRTAVRALDNVIDLNFYPLPYAKLTNQKYRAIGLGVSGYHHMLAKNSVKWESQEHLEFVDEVFENINYAAIEASCDIAAEKGSYSLFEGSDWETGAYFEKRGYDSEEWKKLRDKVKRQGMRNAYLLAIAPTGSTSIIAGTTAGVDPVMNKFFLEEKKGSMLPRVAPDLDFNTWWFYKNAHLTDQLWSVRACGVRQRHIDQAQSMNLYITNDYTLRQVLELYIKAWECGVKTIYYIRSKSLEVEECESCSA